MSWLSEFAGKAENFLNAVDKGAANALTNVNKHTRKHSIKSDQNDHSSSHLDTEFIDTPDIMSLKTSPSTNSLFSENGNGRKGHTRTSSYESNGSRSSASKTLDDDRLMDYLNNKDNDIPEEEWQNLNETTNNEQQSNNKIKSNKEALKQIKELESLNKRILELNSEFKKQKLKAQNYYNQVITNEKLIKELKSKESDLLASISAKDSQIAALKVQTEQMLLEIQEKEDKCREMDNLNQQLNEEISNKMGDNNIIGNLEKEIDSLKQSLKFEKDEAKRIQDNCNQQILRLEDNQRSLLGEVENCHQQLIEAQAKVSELNLNIEFWKKKSDGLEKEFIEFKSKANEMLNTKEEMLCKLNAPSNDEHCHILQEQCNSLINELTDIRGKHDQIKSMLDDAENEMIPKLNHEINGLNVQLEQEKTRNNKLKNENNQLLTDCNSLNDQLNQIKTNLSERIAERDEEIDKLRKQLVLKRSTVTGGDNSQTNAPIEEWEQRLKSLTENLISKQSSIEHLSSANHSLKLQLERSEQKLRELVSNNGNLNNDVAIGIYHSPTFTNLIKHRMTSSSMNDTVPLIQDDPNDGQVARKVKRAYTAIDTFSIRMGNFLRIYPSARALFLIYILILHVWVAFILMYYEPEIHGNSNFT